jgi:hypothetical protein
MITDKFYKMEQTNKVQRSELYNDILKIVKQIPRQNVDGDAMDAASASFEIEKLFFKKLQQHSVMQAEGSDVSEGAAVASGAVGKGVCVDKGRKKDGPCKYPIGTCEWCANIY